MSLVSRNQTLIGSKLLQDLRDKHLWISVFSLSPNSNFTRLQRLGCAFSFIFTAMLTNMMFYDVVPDSGTSGELAGFTFNYGQARCSSVSF